MFNLKKPFFGGIIPHFRTIKKVLLLFSFLPIPLYLLTDIHFSEYGEWGWKILIAVMLIRPLADVLPGIGILHSLVPLRKEFGIMSGLFIFIHSYAFFEKKDQNIFLEIFKPERWSFDSALTWGILGFITVLLLLLTSNQLSIRLLRRQWKNVQRLAYLLFLFSAVHIILISKENTTETLIPVALVFILWLLAHFKVTLYRGPGKSL